MTSDRLQKIFDNDPHGLLQPEYTMTVKQLILWHDLVRQLENGYHMSDNDWRQLLQLNHEVMTVANKIHNESMRVQ